MGGTNETQRGPTGAPLVNLGTPDAPETGAVRRYLREFLSDPRVLDIPAPLRQLLLHAVILPLRPRRSAAAYRKVWKVRGPADSHSGSGSPLLQNGLALRAALEKTLGAEYPVVLGMRYGNPSLSKALGELADLGCEQVVVLPLFPQYAASSTGSALERVYALAGAEWNTQALHVLPPFYDHPDFIASLAELAASEIQAFQPDHVLMSYHGLPERQIQKSDRGGHHCLRSAECCTKMTDANRWCYRAQCFETSRLLAAELGLNDEQYSVAFQSRLGRTPWIEPFTDVRIPELAQAGNRRLAVICPSFTADCLETLEEIGIRAAEQWSSVGGTELRLIPCVNASSRWVDAVANWVRESA
jgi:ferrochelatase